MGKARWTDQECGLCGRRLNSWDTRKSKALVYRYACCERCIAKEYDVDVEGLRRRMEHYFGMRPFMGL